MTCRKCQGFVAEEFGEGRCVNCGRTYTEEELADGEAATVIEAIDAQVTRDVAQALASAPPFVRRKEEKVIQRPGPGRPRKADAISAGKTCIKRSCGKPSVVGSVHCEYHLELIRNKSARFYQRRKAMAMQETQDPQAAATPQPESAPASNGHGGQTVRQVAIGEIDAMIHHLQQTKRILEAFPVVE